MSDAEQRTRPTRAEKRQLTAFVLVCNAADHGKVWRESVNARWRDGFFVRYRPIHELRKDAIPAIAKADSEFSYYVSGGKKRRAVWRSDRCEFWVQARDSDHAHAIARELARIVQE